MMVSVREFTVHVCFYIKLLVLFESALLRVFYFFTIIASSPRYLNTSFVTITFCCLFFFTEGLARPVNNKPPKNQCRNSSDAEERNSSKTCRGENVLHLVATNYKTKLQINITYVRKCFHKFYYLDYPLLLLL